MARKSFAETVSNVKVMVDGLRSTQNKLPLGVTKEMIDNLESLRDTIISINSQQETLKAHLKEKTAELNKNFKAIDALQMNIKKRIKLDVPQTNWIAYGIEDKR